MPDGVPARLDQRQTGQQLRISINQPVAQRRMVPVRARGGKTRMPAARHLVVRALDDQLSMCERIMIADVVRIEVGADEQVNVIGTQAERGELADHVRFVGVGLRSSRRLVIRRHPAIYQDVLAIARLNEIAHNHAVQAATYGYSCGFHRHEIETLRNTADWFHNTPRRLRTMSYATRCRNSTSPHSRCGMSMFHLGAAPIYTTPCGNHIRSCLTNPTGCVILTWCLPDLLDPGRLEQVSTLQR